MGDSGHTEIGNHIVTRRRYAFLIAVIFLSIIFPFECHRDASQGDTQYPSAPISGTNRHPSSTSTTALPSCLRISCNSWACGVPTGITILPFLDRLSRRLRGTLGAAADTTMTSK